MIITKHNVTYIKLSVHKIVNLQYRSIQNCYNIRRILPECRDKQSVIFLQSCPIIPQLVRGKWISRELDKGDDSVIHSRLALACTCSVADKIIYSTNEIVLHASVHGNWHEHRLCSFQSNQKLTGIVKKKYQNTF